MKLIGIDYHHPTKGRIFYSVGNEPVSSEGFNIVNGIISELIIEYKDTNVVEYAVLYKSGIKQSIVSKRENVTMFYDTTGEDRLFKLPKANIDDYKPITLD